MNRNRHLPVMIRIALIICLVLVLTAVAFRAPAQERWPQFRGINGSGVSSSDKPLPAQFDQEKNLIWKCPVREGHSSPCIWGDRIFLTSRDSNRLETACIDRKTGRILWQRHMVPDKMERIHPTSHLAAPTPTTDGKRVFSYFGSCGLICYDFNGKVLWEKKLPLQGNMYGVSVSPILYKDRLILSRDNDELSYLECINPVDGSTIWKTERPDFRANWSTPMWISNQGVDEVLVYGIWWLKAYDLRDGSERWSFPGLTDEPIITPVAGEGLVFLTSYNMRTNPEVLGLPTWDSLIRLYDGDRDAMLAFDEIKTNRSILSRYDADGEGDHPLPGFFRWLDEDRNGRLTQKEWGKIIAWLDGFKFENALLALRPGRGGRDDAEVAWRYTFGVPECPSPLYHEGLVYMVADGGLITCLDAGTGELRYKGKLESGGPYYASPVIGDGKIFACSARGVVTVVEAGPGLKILAHNDLKERIMATPALVDGVIYLRTVNGLYAFGNK